jgi:cysteine-rich repeat protein
MISVFLPALEAEASPNINEQLCDAAVDIVMIMDRSGSMGYDIPTRLSQAQSAANNFLGYLGTNDQSALVSYSNIAVLDKGLSEDHALTQTKVSSLTASGATNIGDAIKLSNQELGSGNANPQAVKIAILLTDGMANKPNGPGFGEYPTDVNYAVAKAGEAAALGYKIFTIGLGNSVNGTMLQNIASATNAQYFFAPTSAQLEGIYKQISARICQYGSISGCKYEDTNKDGSIIGEPTISGWEINLGGHANSSQLTDENGCYQFSGLLPGNYTVSEGDKAGAVFEQTYPAGGSYAVFLPEGQNLGNYDFGNYLNRSFCGDGVKDNNEQCDDGNKIDNDSCSNKCLTNIPGPYCGDGNLDLGEQCDDGNDIDNDSCSSKCLINAPEPYCGNGIKEGSEQCDGKDGVGVGQVCSNICKLSNLTYCGDGIKQAPNDKKRGGPLNDGYEECDGKDGIGPNQTCQSNCVLLNSLCRVNIEAMIVMDVSGSMGYDNPTRLSQAKIAANSFINKLGSSDKSALVAYSTDAILKKPFSNNHLATQTAINNLSAIGATNIGDGIAFSSQEFFNNGGAQALKIEILLTDGKANKPNGYGYGEDYRDVAYAKEKAADAASKGIKIFTIGLGSSINGGMLYDIAHNTGGEYYFAPKAEDLERIFNNIGFDVCKYGSISGCKYEDSNNDGDLSGELALPGWDIRLSGDKNLAQTTDENGCYNFTGLLKGNYNIIESSSPVVDFVQTYPQTLSYDIALGTEEDSTGNDFGNYFPACGNGILDNNKGEQCDDGNNINNDSCSNECSINIPDPYCGDGNLDIGEECDDGNNIDGDNCSASCSVETCDETGGGGDSPVCGDNIKEGTEQCDDGNLDNGDGCSSICEEENNDSAGIGLGDIVINEIMYDPDIVTDANGEWFELINTTANDINLEGCVISDNGSDSHILGSLTIFANGYAVLAKNADPLTNGGITPDYVYSGFTLGNTDDEIILTCNSAEIDRVEYDEGSGWSAGIGGSIMLDDPTSDNNNPANWSISIIPFGAGDKGTPGSQNES